MKNLFMPYGPAGRYYSSGFHATSLESHDTAIYVKYVMQSGKVREGFIELKPFEQKHVSIKQLSNIIISDQNTVYEHYALFLETSDGVFISPREVSLVDVEGTDVMFNNNSELIDASDWPLERWLMLTEYADRERPEYIGDLQPWAWCSAVDVLNSFDKDLLETWKFMLRKVYFQFPNANDRRTHIMDWSANEGLTPAQIEAATPITPEHLASHGKDTANCVDLGYYTDITNITQCTAYLLNWAQYMPEGFEVVGTNMWHGNPTDKYNKGYDDHVSLPKYFDAERTFYLLELMNRYTPSARLMTEKRIIQVLEAEGHTFEWGNFNSTYQQWSGNFAVLENLRFSVQRPDYMDHLLHWHIIAAEGVGLDRVSLNAKIGD